MSKTYDLDFLDLLILKQYGKVMGFDHFDFLGVSAPQIDNWLKQETNLHLKFKLSPQWNRRLQQVRKELLKNQVGGNRSITSASCICICISNHIHNLSRRTSHDSTNADRFKNVHQFN